MPIENGPELASIPFGVTLSLGSDQYAVFFLPLKRKILLQQTVDNEVSKLAKLAF